MKKFWISTMGTENVVGPGGFRDVGHMLRTNGALAYAAKRQQAEAAAAIARVESLAVGEETTTQRGFHPRHGAEMATVRRVA